MADIDRTFVTLADCTRRRVVDLLRKKPRRAGELADAVGITAPAMSRHLRVLREGGRESPDYLVRMPVQPSTISISRMPSATVTLEMPFSESSTIQNMSPGWNDELVDELLLIVE